MYYCVCGGLFVINVLTFTKIVDYYYIVYDV